MVAQAGLVASAAATFHALPSPLRRRPEIRRRVCLAVPLATIDCWPRPACRLVSVLRISRHPYPVADVGDGVGSGNGHVNCRAQQTSLPALAQPETPEVLALDAMTAAGSDGDDELETDRDSFTPATSTVGAGRLILEVAYSFLDNRDACETHSFPEAVLRVGLLPELELRLNWGFEVGGRPARSRLVRPAPVSRNPACSASLRSDMAASCW